MEEEEWVDVDLAVGGQMEDPDNIITLRTRATRFCFPFHVLIEFSSLQRLGI
jgi:hypothetical protein